MKLAGFILISSTLAVVANAEADLRGYNEGWYDSGPVIAIEFGEVTTCIATSSKNRTTLIISDEHGHRSISSSLCITDDAILIGEICLPPNLIVNDLFGLLHLVDVGKSDDEEDQVKQESEDSAQQVIAEDSLPDVAEMKIDIPQFRRELLTPLQLSSAFFSELHHIAERFLGVSVSQATITVPTYLDDHQRAAIRLVGKAAGLEILRVQNRPTIAGVAYDLNDNFGFDEPVFVLFATAVDGSAIDFDLLAYEDGVAEILTSLRVAYDAHWHWETLTWAEELNHHLFDMLNKLERDVPVGSSDIRTVVVAGDIDISAKISEALKPSLPDAQFPTDFPADEVIITGAAKATYVWREDYDNPICCISMQPFAFGIEVGEGIFDMFIPRYVIHPVSVNRRITLKDKFIRIFMGESTEYMNRTMYLGNLELPFIDFETLGIEVNITFSLDINVLNVTATVNDELAFVALVLPEYEPPQWGSEFSLGT